MKKKTSSIDEIEAVIKADKEKALKIAKRKEKQEEYRLLRRENNLKKSAELRKKEKEEQERITTAKDAIKANKDYAKKAKSAHKKNIEASEEELKKLNFSKDIKAQVKKLKPIYSSKHALKEEAPTVRSLQALLDEANLLLNIPKPTRTLAEYLGFSYKTVDTLSQELIEKVELLKRNRSELKEAGSSTKGEKEIFFESADKYLDLIGRINKCVKPYRIVIEEKEYHNALDIPTIYDVKRDIDEARLRLEREAQQREDALIYYDAFDNALDIPTIYDVKRDINEARLRLEQEAQQREDALIYYDAFDKEPTLDLDKKTLFSECIKIIKAHGIGNLKDRFIATIKNKATSIDKQKADILQSYEKTIGPMLEQFLAQLEKEKSLPKPQTTIATLSKIFSRNKTAEQLFTEIVNKSKKTITSIAPKEKKPFLQNYTAQKPNIHRH